MRTDQLQVNRLRFYPVGLVPWWELTSALVSGFLRKSFQFEQVLSPPNDEKSSPEIAFDRGHGPGVKITPSAPIERLTFGPHQIAMMVRHSDGDKFTDWVLQELTKLCDEITTEHKGWVQAHQFEISHTTWFGKLDLDPDELIDSRLQRLIFPLLTKLGPEGVTRTARFRGLSIRLTAHVTRPDWLELPIAFPDEEFRLEPRVGMPAREGAWFSQSPLRSEDHLRLLEEIERAYRS